MAPLSNFLPHLALSLRATLRWLGHQRHIGFYVYGIILLLCVLFFVAGSWVTSFLADWIKNLIMELLQGWWTPDNELGFFSSDFLSNITSALGWMGSIFSWLLSVLLMATIGGSIILVVMSPLLSHVADKAWVMSGRPEPRDTALDIARSIGRGILVALRCLLIQFVCIIALFIMGLIPVVGVVVPLLTFLVSSFFYGQTFIDYAVERSEIEQKALVPQGSNLPQKDVGTSQCPNFSKFTPKRKGDFAFRHLGLVTGLGLPFALAMLIPFIGRYIALFLAPASAAAGAEMVSLITKQEVEEN